MSPRISRIASTRRKLGFVLAVMAVAAVPRVGLLIASDRGVTDELHIARTAWTEDGRYYITLLVPRPIQFDEPTVWYARIRDGSGAPVRKARVEVTGWNVETGKTLMGRGTASYLHTDRYHLPSVRPAGPGPWRLTVTVKGPNGVDSTKLVADLR